MTNKQKQNRKEYYLKNRDKLVAAMKIRATRLRLENPDALLLEQRVKANRWLAKQKSLIHPEHDISIEKNLHNQAIRLEREIGIRHDVDHIIPLYVGGWHHHFNLQVLPKKVNKEKSKSAFWEKDGYKSWRDVPQYLWPENMKPAYLRLLNPLRWVSLDSTCDVTMA